MSHFDLVYESVIVAKDENWNVDSQRLLPKLSNAIRTCFDDLNVENLHGHHSF